MSETCPPVRPDPDDSVQIELRLDAPEVITATTQAQSLRGAASELCKRALSPPLLDAFFHRLIADHFSSTDLLRTDVAKSFVGKVRVAPFGEATADSETLPAVVYRFMGVASQRIAIGDRAESNRPTQQDAMVGLTSHVRILSGSHTLYVSGNTVGEAQVLAFELFEMLTTLSPAIYSRLPFMDFQVAQLSAAEPRDELGNNVACSLTVNYQYGYAWLLHDVGPRLKVVTTEPSR